MPAFYSHYINFYECRKKEYLICITSSIIYMKKYDLPIR